MHPPRSGWTAWPLLVLSALPVAVTAVVARRVLSGSSSLYGELPVDMPLRERATLLLTSASNDVVLLVPLLGLAGLLWLARPGTRRPPPPAALWCGALLAAGIGAAALAQGVLVGYLFASAPADANEFGFLGPNASLLEFFGARAATSLLLAALAIGLVVALVSTVRRPGRAAAALLDEQPPASEPGPPAPLVPEPEPAVADETDPHARYRRPR